MGLIERDDARREDHPAFGRRLRKWRIQRGLSQLNLALQGGSSQRHLSFLESGRARPSREMVLQLADALALPLQEQNAMLVAAGFAPAYPRGSLAGPELQHAARAIDLILAQQEPWPAIAVDGTGTVIRSNPAGRALMCFLLDLDPANPPTISHNLLDLVVEPGILRPFIENWREVALATLQRTWADLIVLPDPDRTLLERVGRLLAEMRRSGAPAPGREQPASPLLATIFRKGSVRLNLISTTSMLGTPLDVTLQELRIEAFFPADEETANALRRLAGTHP